MKTGRLFPLLLACLLGSASAWAQDAAGLDELLGQSIVSTPSKGMETDTTAPATSTVISAEEMRRQGIRSLDEALNYLALGMAASTPGHTAEVTVRGVTIHGDYGTHVLLLVDGHSQNEPWNGTAFFERGAGVPFEMIDHIEVMLGPGSVLYGSQAMLGVINIVTKRAKDFEGARLLIEGDASLPYHRKDGPNSPGLVQELGHGLRLAGGYGHQFIAGEKPTELAVAVDYYRNRGPTWPVGPQPYGDDYVTGAPKDFGPRSRSGTWGGLISHADTIEIPSAYLRFSRGDFQAFARASINSRSTIYPDFLATDAADFDDPFNREVDRFLTLQLVQRHMPSSHVELVGRAYGDLYDYHWYNRTSSAEDCPDGFVTGCVRTLTAVGRVLGGELRSQLFWPVLRASTLLGVDAKAREVRDIFRIEDRAALGAVPDSGSRRTDGLIAPYVAQVLSPTAWLDVNLGLRLDHDTRFGSALSPRSALGVSPWRGGRTKLIYASAFRGPSAYEQTYADPRGQIAAPNLGPERVRSLEASFEQRFGKHRLFCGVFRSWSYDLVGYSLLSPEEVSAATAAGELSDGVEEAYRRDNLGRIDNYGMNAAYDGAVVDGGLRYGLNVTMAQSRMNMNDGMGTRALVVAPQAYGNARVSYDLGGELPTLGLAARFTERRLANRAHDGGFSRIPSAPPLLALRLALSGAVPSLRGLSYRTGVDYSFARVEPYVIGAGHYASDTIIEPELAPVRRVQVFLGLEYVFGQSASPNQP